MAIDLTASLPTMYCTWLDVIGLVATQTITDRADFSNQDFFERIRNISQVQGFITQASAYIDSQLTYQNVVLTTNPWASIPVERGKAGLSRANIGNGTLLGILANAAADISAVWEIKITTKGNKSSARYRLFSFLEGVQGSDLEMGSDNTSNNGDITVGDNSFLVGGVDWEVDDVYLVSVNLAKRDIWFLATTLAAAFLLNSIYTEESPNESKYGAILWSRGMSYMKDLREGRAFPTGTIIDLSPIQVDYNITRFGTDITEYATDDTGSYTP